MMKRILGLIGVFVMVLAMAGVGFAGKAITGEIVKIDGEMISIKDDTGKVQQVHVDPKATKKTGELKQGAKVTAQVNDQGHAESIEVKS